MALIQCPECGKQVSDTARSCPHCGYNLARRHQARRRAVVLLGLVIAIIVGIAVYAVYEHERSERAREAMEAYLDQCPYNTYTDAYYVLNNLKSSDEILSLYRSVREDDMHGIPFEQSRFYKEWPNFYKKYHIK